jgi:hypothetical protein
MLAFLLAACGASSSTRATVFQYPAELSFAVSEVTPQIRARWPDCALDGWTLEAVPEPFTPPKWTWCGTTYCTGKVRGSANTTQKRIEVWAGDPHLTQVVAWELCNACRWEATRILADRGCA